ncbi:hypothetical protein AT15_08945 [Kosmotoga arenicorallina S304]|uniref:Zn-dependent hydrolase n=1 Tax=Kosmotoga arenicorallina S304 TaxID=1453497 RepID=A0A176K1R2_9BACT|nr:MBL fold metallo-hydrolase [Kosmotoga arenicorallina]OAA31092.1 hypothetical protein AT15_08945 [Kosmotoga arenicorallina S304]
MKIRWYGHSCFSIESTGKILLTDPFDRSVGYEIPAVEPDLVTESHQHFDHNAHNLLKGSFEVIKDPGEYARFGFAIRGYLTYHDSSRGAERGTNIIFDITVPEGIRVVHLGDLGTVPEKDLLEKLKEPDVLLIPVGGVYTIDSIKAKELCDELSPKVVIPMHFKTKSLKFNLAPVDEFLKYFNNYEEREELLVKTREEFSKIKVRVIKLKY